MIVIIDNYDSFTYNLYQYIGHYYDKIKILKNDDSKIDLLNERDIKGLVFSPGPGRPSDAGKMPELIKLFSSKIPILGICLGHQAIIENYGGTITNASNVCHGKVELITHNSNSVIFNEITNPFRATRYHSLVASKNNFPDCLEIIAKTESDDEIMAFQHKEELIIGLQFHPESIETDDGLKMIENFINAIK